jgi:hypothetical protein
MSGLGGSCSARRVQRARWLVLHASVLASTATAGSLGCGGTVSSEQRAAQGGSAQGSSTQGGSAQGSSTQGGSTQGGSAQGGSAQGGSAQGGSAQGGSGEVRDAAPAGSGGLASGVKRSPGEDAKHSPIGEGAEPELTTQAITRDSSYYYVTYCNDGAGSSDASFTVELTNTATGESFTTNPLYPFSVPPPGTCATTGGITCELIGDAGCSQCLTVRASVDSSNTVTEADESNNDLTLSIACGTPDLVPQAITRDSTYYYLRYCNEGTGTDAATFTVGFRNTATGESFTSNSLYPFSVPPPGTCAITGGLTCGLIGDPTCSLSVSVEAVVDADRTVVETDELNNAITVAF